jgi:diguanylate cyclase (GGDEF)-like protein
VGKQQPAAASHLSEPRTTEIASLERRTPRGTLRRDRATLTFVEGPTVGAVCTLQPGRSTVLGRGRRAEVRIPDDAVSRRHARVGWARDAYVLEDLDSLTGTWVDGRRVRGRVRLEPGARVHLGPHVSFRFDLHDAREQEVLAGLHEAAMRDALTGAYTRRYLHERLEAELSYAARHGLALALVMLDLDHFKRINDVHGHLAGDEVLRAVAAELRQVLRPEDVLVRYGGEELCLLVRGLDEGEACRLTERVREAVRRLEIAWEGAVLRVTLSAGVAVTQQGVVPGPPDDLVRRADAAMYRAKHLGRDRTCLHTTGGIVPLRCA